MVVIGFLACVWSSSWGMFLSTVTESAAGVESQILDRNGASRANDDGYLEGLQKALGL
jgi:hypothetical protein